MRLFCKYLFVLFGLLAVHHISAQEARKSSFGIGWNLGLNTSNGMGAKIMYTPAAFAQLDIAAGKTAYNGFKFAGGLKIYPLKLREINPYAGFYYSYTLGQEVQSRFGNSRELYTTYSNQYLHPHLGVSMYGEILQHTLAAGYSALVGNYKIDVNPNNTTNENQETIENRLRGGIMLSYTIWIYINKPRR